MNKDKGYIEIRESLRRIHSINEGKVLNEDYASTSTSAPSFGEPSTTSDEESSADAVPYTMQDEIMANITQTAKTQFGADFSQSKNPMLYYPNDGDIVLSGTISSMNDSKFQFRYKGGCFIWTSPLKLDDDMVNMLSVINGVYKNWKKELDGMDDKKPMGFRDKQ